MAYVRRNWVDYPNTSTPIDADALNNIEDGIEESHNIQLLAVTDTAPSECAEGDKYFDTTTNLIYTATGTDEWGEIGETPIADILYIVLDEQTSYTYNGTTLVSVGGGSSTGGETLPVGSEIDYDGTTVPTGWEEISEKSAINVRMSNNATITQANTTVSLTLDTINAQKGTNLTNLNGAVVIGNNVDYVLVSANVMVQTIGTTGNKRAIIQKNGSDVVRSMINEKDTTTNYQTTSITPFLLGVSTGDIISLAVNCAGTDTIIGSGYRDTYLNVVQV